MKAQFRAELLKQRSTRTGLGLFAGMLGLVLLVVLLHGFGLAAEGLEGSSDQLMVLGRGEFLAVLFAALLGALSVTNEIRHGTIRPTFLVSPWRGRVVAAKVWASALIGAGFGLAACALAAGVGTAALRLRGIDVELDGGDYALLLAGGTAAAALWAAIGVGLGAIVRDQVPTLIGICAWLLFVEGLLVGDVAGVAENVGRFAPGALGQALSGQDPDTLLAPALGAPLLALYATAAAAAGWIATTRRGVA
ncbi:MAG: ABC transporter permease subunit [Solirubrobacterales bacterium]|nr:ABC transporter permease subunit [Solirubrobacterales bacterium]